MAANEESVPMVTESEEVVPQNEEVEADDNFDAEVGLENAEVIDEVQCEDGTDGEGGDGNEMVHESTQDNGDETAERPRKRSRSPSPKRTERKDDFNDEELDSEAEIYDESCEDADEEEKILLTMPPTNTVLDDVSHLRKLRHISVHSLSAEELSHHVVQTIISKESCEEMKLHFVRPKDRPQEWSGFVTFNFTSSRAAKEASEELKTIREDLEVKNEDDTSYTRSAIEKWAKDEKGQKRWSETILYVKNIGENVTEEHLSELFVDAEDVVIPKSRSRKADDKTRTAYLIFRTPEITQAAAAVYAEQHVELDGLKLKIYKYHSPPDYRPSGLLKLYERRILLKYLEKLNEKIEASTEEEKAPDWCTKRQKICNDVIERDNRCRNNCGLLTPSLAELRENRGVKVLRGKERRDVLIKLGVIEVRRHDNRDNRRSYTSSSSSSRPVRSLLGNPPVHPPSLVTMPIRGMPAMLQQQQYNMGFIGRQMPIMASSYDTSYRTVSTKSDNKILRLDASGHYHVEPKDRQARSGSREDKSHSSHSRSSRDRDRERDRR